MGTIYKRVHGLIVPIFSVLVVLVLASGCPSTPGVPGPPGPPGPGGSNVGGLFDGIVVHITGVSIPNDRRPVVTFTATDSKGNILAISEFTDVRFVLDYLEAGTNGSTNRFVNYKLDTHGNPTYDGARLTTSTTGGLTQDPDTGDFTYRFATVLPSPYPVTKTHQLGAQFRRTFGGDGKSYPTNVIYDFRPDGGQVTELRDIVDTSTCNNCHTRLSEHGIRREVQYCILCHNKQNFDPTDPTNALDFPVMIHKIHMGNRLPSVVAGGTYTANGKDFSSVVFPQDPRHCFACHTDEKSGVPDETPTMEACGACHDRTWFGDAGSKPVGYTLHAEGAIGGGIVPLSDNSACVTCHRDVVSLTSDHVHQLPTETIDAPGLDFDITDASVATWTTTPVLTITFKVTDKDGNGITGLDNTPVITGASSNFKGFGISADLAWPTTDYQNEIRETVMSVSADGLTYTGPSAGAVLTEVGGGVYTYKYKTAAIPASSHATFAVALEGRRNFVDSRDSLTYTQGTEHNGYTIFVLDSSVGAPVPRRAIVDDEEKCDKCHYELRAHGEQREGLEECLMCHNPTGSDVARRTNPGQYPPLSIHFKSLIHHIHRGENLENPYTIYGFGGSANDFTDVRFPGLLQKCDICHVSQDTANVPLSADAKPTVFSYTPSGGSLTTSTTLPTRQACVACHDATDANLHTVLQSDLTAGTESCAVCHEEEADFAVSKVHALEP